MTESIRAKLGMIVALTCVSLVSLSVACSSSKSSTGGGGDDDDDNGTSSSSSSGGASSSGGDTGPSSVYATELCARVARCFPGSVENSWGDATTCQKAFDRFVAPQKTLPNSGMTEAALAACADKFKTAACALNQDEIPECVFKGTLDVDAACTLGVQCKTGVCIYASQTAACGKCVATVGVGQSCQNAECAPPSFCDIEVTNACVNAPGEGGDCTAFNCGGGLRCVAQKCAKPIAKGAACTAAAPPSDDPCERGLSCIDGTCAEVAVTAKTGEACAPPKTSCIDGACLDNKCVANLKEGASCVDGAEIPPFCEAPMACVGGKCTTYQPAACQ